MHLIASMICRNELQRYLRPCIESLLTFVDEIRVLDDASTDGSYEYLESCEGVNVLRSDEPTFFQHEGRARQRLLDHTLKGGPSHVLALDCDEFVAEGYLVRAFCQSTRLVGTLIMEEVWEAGERLMIRQDGGWRPHPVPILYAVVQDDLVIKDRALACGREPTWVTRMAGRARRTGTSVLHFGWANPATRQERYDRYAVADGGQFHASRHLESILWDDARVKLASRPWPVGLKERLL